MTLQSNYFSMDKTNMTFQSNYFSMDKTSEKKTKMK